MIQIKLRFNNQQQKKNGNDQTSMSIIFFNLIMVVSKVEKMVNKNEVQYYQKLHVNEKRLASLLYLM